MTDILERPQLSGDLCELMTVTQDAIASAASDLHTKTSGALALAHPRVEYTGPETDFLTPEVAKLETVGFTNVHYGQRFITIGDVDYEVGNPHRSTVDNPFDGLKGVRHSRFGRKLVGENETWLGVYVAQPTDNIRRAVSTHGRVNTGEINRNSWGALLEQRQADKRPSNAQLTEAALNYQRGIETALVVFGAMLALRDVTVDVTKLEDLRGQWHEVAQTFAPVGFEVPSGINNATHRGRHSRPDRVFLHVPPTGKLNQYRDAENLDTNPPQ